VVALQGKQEVGITLAMATLSISILAVVVGHSQQVVLQGMEEDKQTVMQALNTQAVVVLAVVVVVATTVAVAPRDTTQRVVVAQAIYTRQV
jgi:hypothetical protein